jgi:phosphonatase-like hydrolase
MSSSSLRRTSGTLRLPQLAVIDMAGTTVDDGALQHDCLLEVLARHGVDAASPRGRALIGYWRDTHGTSKFTVFRRMFDDDVAAAHRANREFERLYDEMLGERGIQPIPGAESAIAELRSLGILVCLATGFARHTQNTILESLGWMGLADLSLCPSDAGRGRPFPDIVLTAVLALDVDDVREVLVVGDTTSDILTGLRAGARDVVGVTTGSHEAEALWAAGATHVVDSIADVPSLYEHTVPSAGIVPLAR